MVNQYMPQEPSTQKPLEYDENMISSGSFEEHDTLSNENISDNGFGPTHQESIFRPKTFIEKRVSKQLEIVENPSKFDTNKRASVISQLRRGESVIEKMDHVNQLELNSGANKALDYLKRNTKAASNNQDSTKSAINDTHNDIESFRNDFLNSFLNYNRYVDPKRRSDLVKKVGLQLSLELNQNISVVK